MVEATSATMRGEPDRVPEYIFPGNFRHGLSLNPSIHLNPSSDKNMENGFGRHVIIILFYFHRITAFTAFPECTSAHACSISSTV